MKSSARHKYSLFLTVGTFLLVVAGGTVTSTKSSMAVPDWPLSFGQWMPPMVGGVALEHGHRMIGAAVGAIILGLAIWSFYRERSRIVRWLAWISLMGVMVQGALGGITVLWGTATQSADTHPVFSTIHGVLGLVVLCLVLSYSQVTSPAWSQVGIKADLPSKLGLHTHGLVWLVFFQVILGAVMRQHNAGMFIPDFPLNHGALVPKFTHWLVGVSYAHRMGALLVTLATFHVIKSIVKNPQGIGWLQKPAWVLAGLLVVQLILGAASVWTALDPVVTVAHQSTGALVLAVSVVLALRTARLEGRLDFISSDRLA